MEFSPSKSDIGYLVINSGFQFSDMIYLKCGDILTFCNSRTCSVSNSVPGEARCGQQSIIPTYLCICNVANIKTIKETHWSNSRMKHSEVMEGWNLHSSIFTLYFVVQFIIMWWDNIFTQVHLSFQTENGVCSVNEKLSKKLLLSCLWFLIFGTTDLHKR